MTNDKTLRSALIQMEHATSLVDTARGYVTDKRDLAIHLIRQAVDVLNKTVAMLERHDQ